MTAPDSAQAGQPAPVGVAAFDFDGTLISRDSFVPFLISVVGRPAFVSALVRSGPSLALPSAIGRRDGTKAALIGRLLGGYPYDELVSRGEAYASVLAGHVRPAMAARVAWHREQDHRLVMVSASLAVYLDPLGRQLGFDGVLSTGLEVGNDGRLTGRLLGANVRRAEKALRLRAWLERSLGGAPYELWAYGDSAGDRELLAMADHPTRI
jgi:HAD superfamily hydrolase (TIGR01490 family)